MAAIFTLEEAIHTLGFGRYQMLLTMVAGIGYAADTIELLFITFLLPELEDAWKLSTGTQSLIASSSSLGILFGSISWGYIADLWGRKIVFVASVVLSTSMSGLSALCPGVPWLCAARFLVGFGLAGNLAVDFVIALEWVPKESRSLLGVVITLFGVSGVAYTAVVAWTSIEPLGWRWYTFLCALPGLSMFFFRTCMHESPHYLLTKGKSEEAMRALQRVAHINGRCLPNGELMAVVEQTPRNKTMQSVMADKVTRWNTILLCCIWLVTSMSYGGVTIWLPKYFKAKGVSGLDIYKNYLLMAAAEVPGLMLARWLVVRGRTRAMSIFLALSSACTIGFALCNTSFLAVLFAMGTYFSVVGCWTCLYLYTPEAYPTSMRATVSGVTRFVSCVGSVAAPQIGGVMLDVGVSETLVLFGLAFALGAVLAFALPIETSDSTELEQPSSPTSRHTALALSSPSPDWVGRSESERDKLVG